MTITRNEQGRIVDPPLCFWSRGCTNLATTTIPITGVGDIRACSACAAAEPAHQAGVTAALAVLANDEELSCKHRFRWIDGRNAFVCLKCWLVDAA